MLQSKLVVMEIGVIDDYVAGLSFLILTKVKIEKISYLNMYIKLRYICLFYF